MGIVGYPLNVMGLILMNRFWVQIPTPLQYILIVVIERISNIIELLCGIMSHMIGGQKFFFFFAYRAPNRSYKMTAFPSKFFSKLPNLFAWTRSYIKTLSYNMPPTTIGINNELITIHKELPLKKRKLSVSTDLLNLRVKRLSPKARVPKRGSSQAAGYDLYRYKINSTNAYNIYIYI
jgi:hypothetical protein